MFRSECVDHSCLVWPQFQWPKDYDSRRSMGLGLSCYSPGVQRSCYTSTSLLFSKTYTSGSVHETRTSYLRVGPPRPYHPIPTTGDLSSSSSTRTTGFFSVVFSTYFRTFSLHSRRTSNPVTQKGRWPVRRWTSRKKRGCVSVVKSRGTLRETGGTSWVPKTEGLWW